MRSVAYAAETVERRNTQTCGEITIGTAAYCGFSEFPSQFARDGCSLRVQRGHSGSALHGRTVDSSGDFDLAFAVEGTQAAHLFVDPGRVFPARDAHIDLRRRFGGHHVGPRSAANDSDVHR